MAKRKRQLAAIMFTDIVGYSAIMQKDEQEAMRFREKHRLVFNELTPKYDGRILQYYGDGTLSVFHSSVSAVECAVAMQRAFRKDLQVPIRIGIHTGDITYDEVEVIGDGVNVASRIESTCIPGGIFISGKVFDDIKNHPWLTAMPLGQFMFKNIEEKIDLYAISNQGPAIPTPSDIGALHENSSKLIAVDAPAEKSAHPEPQSTGQRLSSLLLHPRAFLFLLAFTAAGLVGVNFLIQNSSFFNSTGSTTSTEESSIAVLPFDNYSEDAEDDYFSDGITEDILSLLARIEGLRVVSKTSAMRYKDTKKDSRQIGAELNVRHLLDGSVRRQGNKVRVIAHLTDAQTDQLLWTNTYDTVMTEIFEVQSQVAHNIADALKKELSPADKKMISKKPTSNIAAYDLYLQGRNYYKEYNQRDNDLAIQLFKKAIEVDSTFALAYAGLGDAFAQKGFKTESHSNWLDSAILASKKAIALDPELSEGYKALGLVHHYQHNYDRALAQYHKAVELNPNNSMATHNIGAIYRETGDIPKAIRWMKKAYSLDPYSSLSLLNVSMQYMEVGNLEQGEKWLQKGIELFPDYLPLQLGMGILYLRKGQYEKARNTAAKIQEQFPESPFGSELLGHYHFYQKQYEEAREHYATSIRKKQQHKNLDLMNLDSELGLASADYKLGRQEASRERLEKMLEKTGIDPSKVKKPGQLFFLGSAYVGMGQPERALEALEKAVDMGWYDHPLLERSPLFEELRQRSDFRKIINRAKENADSIRAKVRQMENASPPIDI